MARFRTSPRRRAWPIAIVDSVSGYIAAGCLHLVRRFDRHKMANLLGPLARRVGPFLPEHRVGRANLKAAFPDKSPDEIETILGGVWDNLGRVVADFAHLDRLRVYDPDQPGPSDIEYSEETRARFHAIRKSNKPALLFAAHLANWEIPPLVAHRYGIDTTVLYRRPNLPGIADAVVDMRAGCMGTLLPGGLDAPFKMANALEHGNMVGMLVDQHDTRGVVVQFFGQHANTSPLLARLARQVDCPIYGTRIVRLPNNRFRIELTDAIAPVRDADGLIDVAATMQAVTDVVERWVREYPEQWLWLHRRWRSNKGSWKTRRQARRARLIARSAARQPSSR